MRWYSWHKALPYIYAVVGSMVIGGTDTALHLFADWHPANATVAMVASLSLPVLLHAGDATRAYVAKIKQEYPVQESQPLIASSFTSALGLPGVGTIGHAINLADGATLATPLPTANTLGQQQITVGEGTVIGLPQGVAVAINGTVTSGNIPQ